MLKRLLGMGLVGKLGPVSFHGGSSIRPYQVTCFFSTNTWGNRCFSVVADYDSDLRDAVYTKQFKDVRNIVNGLTEEISEASRVYPGIRYYRRLTFPTKEHKKQYLLEPTGLAEGWLGNAVFDPNMPVFAFDVTEEFLNGSWVLLCSDCRIPTDTAKYFFEHSFAPFQCNVTVRSFRTARCADYQLVGTGGTVVWTSQIYFYNCDISGDLIRAVKAEKKEVRKTGIGLPETGDSDMDLSDIYQEAEARFGFEEEY
jgi:hypothetical protein